MLVKTKLKVKMKGKTRGHEHEREHEHGLKHKGRGEKENQDHYMILRTNKLELSSKAEVKTKVNCEVGKESYLTRNQFSLYTFSSSVAET